MVLHRNGACSRLILALQMRRALVGLGLAVLACSAATAQPAAEPEQGIEAYISQDALQALYVRDIDVGEFGENEFRAGFFLNEDRDLIGIADMLVDVGQPERRPYWALQVGPRVYGALLSVEDQDVFAIGIGGKLSYFIGRDRRSSASVAAYYAPDIVTFGNADDVTDITVQFETQLTESTRVFVGYRTFEFDLDVDREVDDGVHVGIRYDF
jgi:hypothetical protein